MRLSEFDYDLPDELIAKEPANPRDHSRLLIVRRKDREREHRIFNELPLFLESGDVLVLNNTKVLPARLYGTDSTGRRYEVLLLETAGGDLRWYCLARPGKKAGRGVQLGFPEGVTGDVIGSGGNEAFVISFSGIAAADFLPWLSRAGEPPLPPYLKREATQEDRERYQTIYAKALGSVAAPTAGLHFTQEVMDALRTRGVKIVETTLNVGYGTFSPIRTEDLAAHKMHEEFYEVPETTLEAIEAGRAAGKRIVAVGTTTLRALESIPARGLRGKTDIFIQPGFPFRYVTALLTNFHLPKSSLLILVSAFLGTDLTREVYEEAIAQRYRFYSYGDAMLIL